MFNGIFRKFFLVMLPLLLGGVVGYAHVAHAGFFDSLWTRPNLFSTVAPRLLAQFSNSAFFTPVITSVQPELFVGSPDTAIQVVGRNFSIGLPFYGPFLPVELYVNDRQVASSVSADSLSFTATIPADLLKNSTPLTLYVINRMRGVGVSSFSSSNFTLLVIDHPIPNITKITPSEVYRDPPRWIDSVIIDGSDFVPPNAGYTNVGKTTAIYFDGHPIPTSVFSPTQIQASIPKSLLESSTAIGTHKITALNFVGSKVSKAVDFVIKPLSSPPATIKTGGGTSGLAEITYTRAKTPAVNDVRFERFGDSLQLRAKGANFEESRITLNGQSLPTTRDGDDLVATIPLAIRSGLVPGNAVDVRVVNGTSRATLEGTNFTADAGVVVIGGDGVEQTLSSTRVDGKIEADISTLTPGKHTLYVSSGVGKNRSLSPGQEINISGAQ